MIQFFDKSIIIYRLEDVGGNRQAYTTFTSTLECAIQPVRGEKASMAGGASAKMYVIFMDAGKDIVEGDRFVDTDGNWYQVVSGGVERRDDGFMADYLSVTVKKVNV